MEKGRESIENFSEEELKKEADTVREKLTQESTLKTVKIPDGIHERMAERIQRYEEEKAIESLSEQDKEALRLGKEFQEKAKQKKMSKSRRRKILAMAASVFIVVLGAGITSVGGKKFIVDVFEKNFGGGEKTYVDTNEIESAGEMTEDTAYDEIESAFGTKIVRIIDKPSNMYFLEMQLDEEMQEAILYYSLEENIISYRIVFPYTESSSGVEIQDKFLQEYILELPKADVVITEYQIQETGESEYAAQFTYENAEYFLTGIVNREKFEKIVKNLNFF